MREQSQLTLFDETDSSGPLIPFPSHSLLPTHDALQRRELYKELGRLIDRMNYPAPRVKRRRRLQHVSEILE